VQVEKTLNRAQLVEREELVWEHSAKGWSNRRIAREMGLSHPGVAKILERIEARALRQLATKVENQKIRLTQQLIYIVETATDSWRSSNQPRTRVTERKTEGGDTQVSTEVVEQSGDRGHLHTAMSAMDRIARIWGLEVLAAGQDSLHSMSALAADLVKRAKQYEQGKAPVDSPANPGGIPPGPQSGVSSMSDIARSVQ
jgi:hypothetical protein